MPLIYRRIVFRQEVRDAPFTLFVFGDNVERRGLGGQAAEMRGEPNAVGMPTKHQPSRQADAYFADADFALAKPHIDKAMMRLAGHLRAGGTVVWPKAGIGTGRADLERRAPRIWRYIERCRRALERL